MKTSKEFVQDLRGTFNTLFNVADQTTREYFATNPTNEQLVGYFKIRLFNERWNMVELSQAVANLPVDTPIEESQLLAKQAWDEANHFRMVKEVIEHITGKQVDVASAISAEAAKPTAKGAALLEKYEAQQDPLALAAYQFIAEGRAERVWHKMAECIQDEFISTTYAKIARDEGFHSNIGARALELLATDEATQARVEEIARTMRMDLFTISCMNTTATAEAKNLMGVAY